MGMLLTAMEQASFDGPPLHSRLQLLLQRAIATTAGPEDQRRTAEAAMFALAIACGHLRFQEIVSDGIVKSDDVNFGCEEATLAGRDDWRKHFALSAGLQAAGDGPSAFAIGELKELLDAEGGSGFSFDDLAADRAGIRFSQAVLQGDPADWAGFILRLESDAAIFPSVQELPTGLTEEEFLRDIRDVNSPRYKELIEVIDRRLDELPFFRDLVRSK
ncbi:MAG: hypothetical protein HC923_06675 [Myxococcales bacterium]|nr:hypothetical protein [Myxococcales bacterium]